MFKPGSTLDQNENTSTGAVFQAVFGPKGARTGILRYFLIAVEGRFFVVPFFGKLD